MTKDINELYARFLQKTIPNNFILSDAEVILKNEYSAVEVNIKDIAFLLEPAEIHLFNKCYKINNDEVISRILTNEEKDDINNLKELNKEFANNFHNSTPSEQEYTRIQEGEYFFILLGVNEGHYIDNGRLIGHCQKLYETLTLFIGMEKKDCNINNPLFHEYLEALSNLGYLD
jgi:hypothetical protein